MVNVTIQRLQVKITRRIWGVALAGACTVGAHWLVTYRQNALMVGEINVLKEKYQDCQRRIVELTGAPRQPIPARD